jgi:hypothetical protein
MDIHTAQQAALKEFLSRHGRRNLADFVDRFVTVGSTRASIDSWSIDLLVHPKAPLEPGYQREFRNGRSVLTCVDPKTGRKQIVIHHQGVEPITIFRAVIDVATGGMTVEVDQDPSFLNWADYEMTTSE